MSDHSIADAQGLLTETDPPRNYLVLFGLGIGGVLQVAWIGLIGRGALWLIGY